jgi:hypothetical protein
MEKLNLARIISIQEKNKKKKIDIVEYHYYKIIERIKRFYNDYKDFCYYDVDTFIPKLPFYDANVVAVKIVDYMVSKGFQCRVIYGNRIFISWKPKERKKDHIPVIMKMVTNRIYKKAKEDQDYCYFEVPVMLLEFPWYDAEELAVEISKKISEKGFIVNVNKNILKISWEMKELKRRSDFKTSEEKRKEAIDKINYINQRRYDEFAK